MFAIVLIVIAVAGIAWPFLRRGGLIPAPVEGALQNVRQRLHLPAPQTVPADGPNTPSGHTEQLCPQCTSLNRAGVEKCEECGASLLAAKITDLWAGSKREEAIQEGIIGGVFVGVLLLAMFLSNSMPVWGKTVIILAALATVTVRFVRNFGE